MSLFSSVRLRGFTVLVFKSLIVWLEASTFIKLYGLHSLIKCYEYIMLEDINKHDKNAVDDQLLLSPIKDALLAPFFLMHGTILMLIKFNYFSILHLNRPIHLFQSFCCTTLFELMCVYELDFNMDKYGTYINTYTCTYVQTHITYMYMHT